LASPTPLRPNPRPGPANGSAFSYAASSLSLPAGLQGLAPGPLSASRNNSEMLARLKRLEASIPSINELQLQVARLTATVEGLQRQLAEALKPPQSPAAPKTPRPTSSVEATRIGSPATNPLEDLADLLGQVIEGSPLQKTPVTAANPPDGPNVSDDSSDATVTQEVKRGRRRRRRPRGGSDATPTATAAIDSSDNQCECGQSHSRKVKCWRCHARGHPRRCCPDRPADAMAPAESPSAQCTCGCGRSHPKEMVCNRCKSSGHPERCCKADRKQQHPPSRRTRQAVEAKQCEAKPVKKKAGAAVNRGNGTRVAGGNMCADCGVAHSLQMQCYHCDQAGHLRKCCPERGRNRQQGGDATIRPQPVRVKCACNAKDRAKHSPQIICRECGYPGHIMACCLLRNRKN
jgi:hypothetical protein